MSANVQTGPDAGSLRLQIESDFKSRLPLRPAPTGARHHDRDLMCVEAEVPCFHDGDGPAHCSREAENGDLKSSRDPAVATRGGP